MKRIIGYIILGLVVIIITLFFIGVKKFNHAIFKEKSNYLEYTSEEKPIHFDWADDTIGNYYEPQVAMTIPLKIKGLKHRFYMQFDTGSPHTFFYGNDVESLQKIGVDIQAIVTNDEKYVKQLDFVLDDNAIQASMIKILENYGNSFNQNDTIRPIKIGTIGSDFMVNCITSIDFKNQTVQFFDDRPGWMHDLPEFSSFDFSGRRIMLPVQLDNKNYEFLYDSGCSAFGLITTKNRFKNYTNRNTKEVKYGANSWGSNIPINSKKSDKLFLIGNSTLQLKRVSYVDMYTFIQPLVTPFTRIGGWMGNQPFNESTLILDSKSEEFQVIDQSDILKSP